ncbi:MAG: hypothetical protein WBM46_18985 [Polyangiales bacterium]|jgi:hypothetical protein
MKATARFLLAALFVLATTMPAFAGAEGETDIKNCYSVNGEARYGALAYKHVVIVTNRCDITLQCEVWTDVDPSPKLPLTVGPNSSGEVLVRAVSPSRNFKAFGECKKE